MDFSKIVDEFMEKTGSSKENAEKFLQLSKEEWIKIATNQFINSIDFIEQETQTLVVASLEESIIKQIISADLVISLEATLLLLKSIEITEEEILRVITLGVEEFENYQIADISKKSVWEVCLSNPKYNGDSRVLRYMQSYGVTTKGKEFMYEMSEFLSIAKRINKTICMLITKPSKEIYSHPLRYNVFRPSETVVVRVSCGEVLSFGVFDFHPRPDIDINGAHTREFNNIYACTSYLRKIFPIKDIEDEDYDFHVIDFSCSEE